MNLLSLFQVFVWVVIFRGKKLASPQLLLLDCPLDPGRVVRNLDVDAVLPLPAAALPEGGDAVQRPAVVLLAE